LQREALNTLKSALNLKIISYYPSGKISLLEDTFSNYVIYFCWLENSPDSGSYDKKSGTPE
jgi:hypothetical protein